MRIDSVAGGVPGRLLPVETIHTGRRGESGRRRQEPGASFARRKGADAGTYAPPPGAAPPSPDPAAPAAPPMPAWLTSLLKAR